MPLLIEAESIEFPRPNAVCFHATPNEPALAKTFLHFKKEVEDLKAGSEPVNDDKLEEVSQDLASNPPLKFDLARVVRVFNAQFQFVEFELTGFMISKMSVPIPSDLMGLAKDEQTRKLLRSTFKLVRDDCEISGRSILKAKKKISKDYLVSLTGFGNVCLRTNKDRFLEEVEKLRSQIDDFHKQVEQSLQKEMDANRKRLAKALLPAVAANPPSRWVKFLGPKPSRPAVRECLDHDLAHSFRSAEDLIKEMKISVIFKDVTYESLSDPEFLEVARKALPNLRALCEEYSAAKEMTEAAKSAT